MTIDDIPEFIQEHYEIHEWRHASAVLANDFPKEWEDLLDVLLDFRLRKSWIEVGGGRKSQVAEAIDHAFFARDWVANNLRNHYYCRWFYSKFAHP